VLSTTCCYPWRNTSNCHGRIERELGECAFLTRSVLAGHRDELFYTEVTEVTEDTVAGMFEASDSADFVMEQQFTKHFLIRARRGGWPDSHSVVSADSAHSVSKLLSLPRKNWRPEVQALSGLPGLSPQMR
jgi:hypothetical protein